ncbi:MAG: DUF4214 domain-containing protein [Candidatus Pristimantibacillus sp.]
MKRKGHRKGGLRNRLARRKRRKHAQPSSRLTRRSSKGRKRGKRWTRVKKSRRNSSLTTKLNAASAIDTEQLQTNNTHFRQSLSGNGRIIDWFREIMKLGNEDFIWEMYRQILQREPDSQGFIAHRKELEAGTPKAAIASSIIQSSEAETVFGRGQSGESNTAAHIIQSIYPAAGLDFIHALHMHLLNREPDGDKIDSYVGDLRQGLPRRVWIARLLLSEEIQNLLHNESLLSSIQGTGVRSNYRNIGIFLCFGSQITMEGEGIGRFIVRLSEGLLSLNQSYTLHVATTDVNFNETSALYRPLMASYPEQIRIYHADSMDHINKTVPAEVWIVPYIGMALAQYLHKPFIVCLHDLVYLHFPDLYAGQNAHYQYIHSIAQKVAVNASAVVFDSEFTKRHEGLSFLGLPEHKTAVVRFAAPHEEYSNFGTQNEEQFRHKYNLFGPYITFPSVIRLHKNHERLIDAFHRFRLTEEGKASGLKLVFTDDMHDRPRQQEIINALNGISDPDTRASVVFLGRIGSTDLPSLYKYAVGAVVPTLFEGSCPFPILESLLMDTPVSFGRLEIVQEVLADMSSFATFDPYDPTEMADAINRLWLEGKSVVHAQKAAFGGILHRSWADVASDYAVLIERIAMAGL